MNDYSSPWSNYNTSRSTFPMPVPVTNSPLFPVGQQSAFPNDDSPCLRYSYPTPQQVLQPYQSFRGTDNIRSHTQSSGPSPLEINHSLTTNLDTLINLAGRLRPFLLSSSRWFGQEDLKVVGTFPIGAGGFADVWDGKVGDRRVAVKSYRSYTSADCMLTYKVGHP